MKGLLFLLMSFLVVACNNDDGDDSPQNPADSLPPPTQTGEGTFGCLIDGEPFFPGSGNDRPFAFYQFVRGAFTLGISASRNNGGGENFISVGIGALDIEVLQERTYSLNTFESENFYGQYLLGGGIVLQTYTTEENPGTLTITNFTDEIISGTFEFTMLDNNGSEIRITNGRFDLKYTN